MKDENKRRKFYCILIITFAFIIAIVLIGIGVYFNMITSNNYIMGTAIDKSDSLLKNYLENNSHQIKDNYTLNSKINFNLDSEEARNKSITDLEALKRVNYLKNLSLMNIEINLKKDAKKKRLLFELDEKILEEEIVNYKYLIENSTEYYFLNNFLNNYVNDGSCNYFESLNSENTSEDNIIYLHDFLIESLKKNLKDEYFERYDVTENISGKDTDVKQISLRLTDSVIRDILRNILNDLKSDEQSKKILTSIDKNFSKWKVKDSTEFLKGNESYTINVYTTSFMCQFLKLEVIHLDGNDKSVVTYEGDETKGEVYYIENDKIKYIINCTFKNGKYVIKIQDELNKNLGEFSLEFDKKRTNFIFNFDDASKKIDIIYSSKYRKKSGGKSINEMDITFKYLENRVSKLSGEVQAITEISDDVKIDEDVSNAVLKASLTNEQKANLDTRREFVKTRLER